MGEDQVTIDPEFLPPPERGRGRSIWWVPIAGAVVAAFFFGWLLGSPASIEPDKVVAAGSTTTAPSVETTLTTVTATTSVPRTPPRLAVSDVPLTETVPGFKDTIVMLTTPEDSFNVMRWKPSKPTTEVVLALDRDEDGWFGPWPVGLDASGNWFAQVQGGGELTVHGVPDAVGEWAESESVGLHVGSVIWHETDPGRLAWVECPRSSSGPAVLFTLDVADRSVDPVLLRSFDGGCAGAYTWLEEWTSRGVLIGSESEGRSAERVLIDADGTEILIGFDSSVLAESPDGATLWIEHDPEEPGATWFLLSQDGQQRIPVPGLAANEGLFDASWSPDGNHMALSVAAGLDNPVSVIRVVDSVTGAVLAERGVPGYEIIAMAWSSDGRFLVYEAWNSALEFYDTATDTTIRVPLSEIVDEIRVIGAPDSG